MYMYSHVVSVLQITYSKSRLHIHVVIGGTIYITIYVMGQVFFYYFIKMLINFGN